MDEERAFLDAIRERPEDEAVRLVYADWLEERADPRHALIRVEAAMRRVPVHSEEYQQRKPERERLRRLAPAGWLDAMGYRPTHRPLFTTLPETTAERWRLAAEFIELWHHPLEAGDGFGEAELDAAEARIGSPLPRALREWYAFAGRRTDIWSRQDHLVAPDRLRRGPDGQLIIRYENQNVTRWYIREEDLQRDDPPVYEADVDSMTSETVSAFALCVLVSETTFTERVVWCHVYDTGGEPLAAPAGLLRAALSWRFRSIGEESFWEGTDLVLRGDAECREFMATCRTEAAYQRLCELYGDAVERFWE